MTKKIISIILCAIMLLSVAPITVFAEETQVSTYQQLWQAIHSGKESITLANDISYTIEDNGNTTLTPATYLNPIYGDTSITLDLAGHTLYVKNESKTFPQNSTLFSVSENASLTVLNGTVSFLNLYKYSSNTTNRTISGMFAAKDNAYLVLTNVNVNMMSIGPAIKTGNNATVTIEAGTIKAFNGFALFDESSSTADIFLDKNVKLTTSDGISGTPTQFSISGYGSAHINTPNLTIVSATFTSGVEVSENTISAFAPSSSRRVFVDNTEYANEFGKAKTGAYYWYEVTGGYALISTAYDDLHFAKNIQIISKSAKNYVTVTNGNGTASPNYAAYGDTVTVTAKKISGKVFNHWVVPSGNASLANAYSETTTFTMGADPVEVQPVYDKALTHVSNVKFNVKTPLGGQKLGVPTSASDIVTINEYYWIELYDDDSFSGVLPENTVAQAGHRYKLFIDMSWDGTEYAVDENTVIKYFDPDKNTSVDTVLGVTNQIRIGVLTADAPEEIKNLSATVGGITPGAQTGSTTVTAGESDYFATVYGWYNTDNPFAADTSNRMTLTDTFEANKTYVVAIRFTATGERVFASAMNTTINGQDGFIGSSDGGSRLYYAAVTVPKNKNGFIEENDNVYYYKDGNKVKGWFTDGGKKYYSDNDGIVQYGFTEIGTDVYYLDEAEGYMVTGWQTIYDKQYYFGTDGKMYSHKLAEIDGKKYYFGTDGAMYTKRLISVSGKKYYMGADGAAYTKRLISVSGKKYYMGADGVAYTKRLISVNGKKYYMGADGVAYTKRLISVDGKKYYMGADGVAYTSKLISVNGKKYYMGKDGVAYKSKLISVSGKKYYIGKDCIAYKSKFASLSGKKYYFGSDCVMYKSKTFSVSGVKWKADSNGVCKKV